MAQVSKQNPKYVPSQYNRKKNVLQKGPEAEKKFGIEPTAQLVNHCFVYVVLTTANDSCSLSSLYTSAFNAL